MKRPHQDGASADVDEALQASRAAKRSAKPVISYRSDLLPTFDSSVFTRARATMKVIKKVVVPPRDAATFEVPAGHFFRIVCVDGPQVGDLNLWNLHNMNERFYTSKTRQLHATHLSTGNRLWSSFPYMRPMATITKDTLDWYGWDEDGAGVHDVIGSRCDPYTNSQLQGVDYDRCCHSNLTRALAARSIPNAESHVHDVLNVFMATGFTKDTHQYFMKASPVRPGDFLEFFAEIDLLGALSTCPGGDCSTSHSGDAATCHPFHVEIYKPESGTLDKWQGSPPASAYAGKHGL